MNDCVATAPTPASAQETFEPTENQWLCTATPSSPVAGSRATIEYVATGRGGASDRCLQPIETPVNTDFALEYITGSEYESSGVAELTEAEMSVSVFDGEAIDVDEIVKEQILLAVPTRMLCREDCKGICPECGTDRNTGDCNCVTNDTDPRWAALKNLI